MGLVLLSQLFVCLFDLNKFAVLEAVKGKFKEKQWEKKLRKIQATKKTSSFAKIDGVVGLALWDSTSTFMSTSTFWTCQTWLVGAAP